MMKMDHHQESAHHRKGHCHHGDKVISNLLLAFFAAYSARRCSFILAASSSSWKEKCQYWQQTWIPPFQTTNLIIWAKQVNVFVIIIIFCSRSGVGHTWRTILTHRFFHTWKTNAASLHHTRYPRGCLVTTSEQYAFLTCFSGRTWCDCTSGGHGSYLLMGVLRWHQTQPRQPETGHT